MTHIHSNHEDEVVSEPLLNGLDSEAVRARQLAMVERFKEVSAQMGLGLEGDEKLFPPENILKKVDMIWTDKRQDPEQQGPKISLHDVTKRSIFSRNRVNGNKNNGYLPRYDTGVMPLVKAMIDEYVLCEYWDQMGAAAVTEGVRAQVANHYSQLLLERGYPPEQALKVVGNGIKAYMSIATRLRWREASAIQPFWNGEPPDVMISSIRNHGRTEAEKQGFRDAPRLS